MQKQAMLFAVTFLLIVTSKLKYCIYKLSFHKKTDWLADTQQETHNNKNSEFLTCQ